MEKVVSDGEDETALLFQRFCGRGRPHSILPRSADGNHDEKRRPLARVSRLPALLAPLRRVKAPHELR